MKKILIITLAQGSNYGGMLQAYALQTTVKQLGYKVETTYTKGPIVRRLIKSFPGVQMAVGFIKGRPKNNNKITTRFTRDFVSSYVNVVNFDKAFWNAKFSTYSAYITGSDQVWRSSYTFVPHNLLSFAPRDAVKISYAGSFGRDDLSEYSAKLMSEARSLAGKMTALSMRESSGVDIAKRNWGLNATQNVDPTLLVQRKEYEELINAASDVTYKSPGSLFSYVLDPAFDKQGVSEYIASLLGLKPFNVIDGDENNGKPMPRVEQWLRSFQDSGYVVTDSFHGTVFSIIFNKPFIAIGNKERGLARFESLLRMFGLEDRLVTSIEDVTKELIKKDIDWASVNGKIKSEQKRSIDYLKKYLG